MFRVLVLIGAFLIFRAVLRRGPRWSSTATTPYMSALDGMLSAQQVSSVLDEVRPHESWLASRRAKPCCEAQDDPLTPYSIEPEEHEMCAAQVGPTEILRP